MNKLEQAARQALEALEALEEATNYTWSPSMSDKCNAAITALREVLETVPAESNHDAFKLGYAKGVDDAERRAKARGEQPAAVEQEPVAWQYRLRPTWVGGKASWGPWELCTKGQAEDCWKTPLLHDWAAEARPLYTAPQPARQTLTDKQIASACFSYRHDFGLLPKQEQESIIFQAREWDRAFNKERT